ncbi:MAG: hypothetical protein AMJ92_04215 [candidate division Zixibacteria bacterium SM23_81]|nr:MAG: hypothetical protein AMJ92_04215 [candidate division Zixibacteria bacterium SM23_81]
MFRNVIFILWVVFSLVASQVLIKTGLEKIGGFSLNLHQLIPNLGKVLCSPLIWLGLIITGSAALVWFDLLSKLELSFVYPMVSLSYVFALFAAWLIFKEDVSLIRLIGVLFVCLGVFLISRS